jgi:hypothetical protein
MGKAHQQLAALRLFIGLVGERQSKAIFGRRQSRFIGLLFGHALFERSLRAGARFHEITRPVQRRRALRKRGLHLYYLALRLFDRRIHDLQRCISLRQLSL